MSRTETWEWQEVKIVYKRGEEEREKRNNEKQRNNKKNKGNKKKKIKTANNNERQG